MSGRRVYRTAEGRHVLAGDPQAAFLAYGVGDEVPPEVEQELTAGVPVKRKPGRPPGSKSRKDREGK